MRRLLNCQTRTIGKLFGLQHVIARGDHRRHGGRIGFYGATPVIQPAGASQAAVTLGNTDGESGGLTISDPSTHAEVQALRDKCEELADDVRALAASVPARLN